MHENGDGFYANKQESQVGEFSNTSEWNVKHLEGDTRYKNLLNTSQCCTNYNASVLWRLLQQIK